MAVDSETISCPLVRETPWSLRHLFWKLSLNGKVKGNPLLERQTSGASERILEQSKKASGSSGTATAKQCPSIKRKLGEAVLLSGGMICRRRWRQCGTANQGAQSEDTERQTGALRYATAAVVCG
jgi:hypothetical protein